MIAARPGRRPTQRTLGAALVPALLLAIGCGGGSSGSGGSSAPRTSSEASSATEGGSSSSPSNTSESGSGSPGSSSGSTTHSVTASSAASGSPYAAQYSSAPALETLTGRASYYSDRLAGRSTASGEPYRTTEFTAASRDLRFGTILRVTREDTGTVTYARVNDRGPFGDRRRIIDLSRAAAEELDMIRAGVVPVRVEIVYRPAR
jgi:rare lipoprotein A